MPHRPQGSLYFGIGLVASDNTLSEHLPFDILSMLFTAEHLRREHITDHNYILIADSHAIASGADKDEIHKIAIQRESELTSILSGLQFTDWTILRASTLASTEEYNNILATIPLKNPYERQELADIAYFATKHDVGIKLGWAVHNGKRDETAFDTLFSSLVGLPLHFIYTIPGKTCDPQKPRSPPYICTDPRARILLDQAENVHEKLATAEKLFGKDGVSCYTNLIRSIIRAYTTTIGPLPSGNLAERAQELINMCFQDRKTYNFPPDTVCA
jgi:hypothetical protein